MFFFLLTKNETESRVTNKQQPKAAAGKVWISKEEFYDVHVFQNLSSYLPKICIPGIKCGGYHYISLSSYLWACENGEINVL